MVIMTYGLNETAFVIYNFFLRIDVLSNFDAFYGSPGKKRGRLSFTWKKIVFILGILMFKFWCFVVDTTSFCYFFWSFSKLQDSFAVSFDYHNKD